MLIKITFHFLNAQCLPHTRSCYSAPENNKQLKNDLPRVWLLLYDLYLRTFSKRKPELLNLKDKLFKESEMLCELLSVYRGKLMYTKFK